MWQLTRIIPVIFVLTNASAYIPEPEEELLATLIIRTLFKNEETFRYRVFLKTITKMAKNDLQSTC